MGIRVAKTATTAVRRGHPWVYREGLVRPPRDLATGAVVDLEDDAGSFLGRGLFDATSPIAVRLFTLDPAQRLDAAAIAARVERAAGRRARLFADGDTDAYRLCNGEGDRVPGLVLDRYGDLAVMRLDGDLLDTWTSRLVPQLAEVLGRVGIASLALRIEPSGKDASLLRPLHGGPPPDRRIVLERGMRMEVDLARGQKTGAFLDQRENRARVRKLAGGRKSVLNLYSYAGGFSIAAALGGANKVTSVDSAAAAHFTAQRTFRENGVDPEAHGFVTADVFEFLERARTRGERFDLVISDPPSFAPNEKVKPRALAAYRRLHGAIAKILTPEGIFCAASCSSHVTTDDFLGTLDDGVIGDRLAVTAVFGQPEDHPSTAAWREGRYLKFVVLEP